MAPAQGHRRPRAPVPGDRRRVGDHLPPAEEPGRRDPSTGASHAAGGARGRDQGDAGAPHRRRCSAGNAHRRRRIGQDAPGHRVGQRVGAGLSGRRLLRHALVGQRPGGDVGGDRRLARPRHRGLGPQDASREPSRPQGPRGPGQPGADLGRSERRRRAPGRVAVGRRARDLTAAIAPSRRARAPGSTPEPARAHEPGRGRAVRGGPAVRAPGPLGTGQLLADSGQRGGRDRDLPPGRRPAAGPRAGGIAGQAAQPLCPSGSLGPDHQPARRGCRPAEPPADASRGHLVELRPAGAGHAAVPPTARRVCRRRRPRRHRGRHRG